MLCIYNKYIYVKVYAHTFESLTLFYRILSSFEQINLWKHCCIHICRISLAFAMIHSTKYSKKKIQQP